MIMTVIETMMMINKRMTIMMKTNIDNDDIHTMMIKHDNDNESKIDDDDDDDD